MVFSIQYLVFGIQYSVSQFSMQIATETDFVSTLRDIYLSDQVDNGIQYSVFSIWYSVFRISIFDANSFLMIFKAPHVSNHHYNWLFSIQYSVFWPDTKFSHSVFQFSGVATTAGREDGWKSYCGVEVPIARLSGMPGWNIHHYHH